MECMRTVGSLQVDHEVAAMEPRPPAEKRGAEALEGASTGHGPPREEGEDWGWEVCVCVYVSERERERERECQRRVPHRSAVGARRVGVRARRRLAHLQGGGRARGHTEVGVEKGVGGRVPSVH